MTSNPDDSEERDVSDTTVHLTLREMMRLTTTVHLTMTAAMSLTMMRNSDSLPLLGFQSMTCKQLYDRLARELAEYHCG